MIRNYLEVVKKNFFLVLLIFLVAFMFIYNDSIKNEVNLVAVNIADKNITGGSVIKFDLEMKKGEGKDFLDISSLTKFDTQYSLKYAKNFACDILDFNCQENDFYYTIDAKSGIISGPSAGSAMTLTFLASLNSKKIPDDIAITGFISSGGWIGPVGGIEEKIKAAEKNGLKKIYIPKSERILNGFDLVLKYSHDNFEVVAVENIYELYKEVFGEDLIYLEGSINETPYINQLKVISEDICNTTNTIINNINNSYNKEINEYLENASSIKESLDFMIKFLDKVNVDLYQEQNIIKNYNLNKTYSKYYNFFCEINDSKLLELDQRNNFCFYYDEFYNINKENSLNFLYFDNFLKNNIVLNNVKLNEFIINYKKNSIDNLVKSYNNNYEFYLDYKKDKDTYGEKYLEITRLSNIYSYYKEGLKLINRADLFFNQSYFYGSASSCFGANLDLDYYNIVIDLFRDEFKNFTNKEYSQQSIIFKLNNELNKISYQLSNYDVDLDLSIENPQIDYVINSRYQDAISSFSEVVKEISEINISKYDNESSYFLYQDLDRKIYDMVYSKNRFLTSEQWAKFKNLEEYNNETQRIPYMNLYSSCNDAYNYAKIDYEYIKSETGVEIYKDNLDKIQSEFEDGFYYACIFDSITLRSLYSNLMAVSATSDQEQLFEEKKNLAYYYLNKNNDEFPLLSYSYLEYANALEDTDIYSSLNYLEESIAFNNINIYLRDLILKYNEGLENDNISFFDSIKVVLVKYNEFFYILIIFSLILELFFLNKDRQNKLDDKIFKDINKDVNYKSKEIEKNDFMNYLNQNKLKTKNEILINKDNTNNKNKNNKNT